MRFPFLDVEFIVTDQVQEICNLLSLDVNLLC